MKISPFRLKKVLRWRLICNSTNDPTTGPSTPQGVIIQFEKGIPVKVSFEGKSYTDRLELFIALNEIGKLHGIGRIDIVEVCTHASRFALKCAYGRKNRYVGIKSRGCSCYNIRKF